MNKKGFASSTIIYGLLSVFLIAISILIYTMNSNVSLNKSLNEKTIENIEYGSSSLSELENRITELEGTIIDKIYPVGSIYMSATDDTVEKVEERFGGTWEVYAQGRTLVGVGTTTDANGNALTYTSNETGGSSLTSLSESNIPSHSHVIPSLFGTASNGGEHNHIVTNTVGSYGLYADAEKGGYWSKDSEYWIIVGHSFSTSYSLATADKVVNRHFIAESAGEHTHSVTTNISNTTECTNCSATSFSIQNPYIVTYMYKRIK